MTGYYIPRSWEVCIFNKNDGKDYKIEFETIYPYLDIGWNMDLDAEVAILFGDIVDYEITSFAMEL